MPFIKHHLKVFQSLSIPWTWHIWEGIANNPFAPGSITAELHRDSLSVDGTSQYLDDIVEHPNVRIIRCRHHWDAVYLTERFDRMLTSVEVSALRETIAWQIDVDEYWTADQIHKMVEMFQQQPEKQAAWFHCRYFVGPHLALKLRTPEREKSLLCWKRVWRHTPGLEYCKHDPPCVRGCDGVDIFYKNAFTHEETAAAGLIFNHYAYVTPAQLRFKEQRYGFKGAYEDWRRLNSCCIFPTKLRQYISWLEDDIVEIAPAEHWFTEE